MRVGRQSEGQLPCVSYLSVVQDLRDVPGDRSFKHALHMFSPTPVTKVSAKSLPLLTPRRARFLPRAQLSANQSEFALQSSLTTGLSNKADQSAFDVLEGVVATKSTPDSVDLKLSNYSTTAAMNGSIASANNATLATVAANYGLKTVVEQHFLDIAARITPLEVDTKVANALRACEQRRLHLGAADLQGGRQRPDRLRPAVGRGHFLGGGL